MDELNYASLEASKRLQEAGIVLKTDISWELNVGPNNSDVWILGHRMNSRGRTIPAPSMAEVWRELPEGTGISQSLGTNFSEFVDAEGYRQGPSDNPNPTDALIDLLIWVKKEAHHG